MDSKKLGPFAAKYFFTPNVWAFILILKIYKNGLLLFYPDHGQGL